MLHNINSMLCYNGTPGAVTEWTARGGRWIERTPRPDVSSAQEVYDYLVAMAGLTNPNMHGVIIDEFDTGSSDIGGYWADASEMILSDPAYAGKMIVPYTTGVDGDLMGCFLNMIVSYNSYFA